MSTQDFLELFKIHNFYEKRSGDSFVLSRRDYLTQTKNSISFIFEPGVCQIVLKTTEFNDSLAIFDATFSFSPAPVLLLEEKNFKNEILPFLDFKNDIPNSLGFIARFTNEILVPKYQLGATLTNLE